MGERKTGLSPMDRKTVRKPTASGRLTLQPKVLHVRKPDNPP